MSMRAAPKWWRSTANPSFHLSHPTPDCVVWNTIIRALQYFVPISSYLRMRRHGVQPDFYTFPFLLHSIYDLAAVRHLHAHIFLSGFLSDHFVQTSIVTVLADCGSLEDAQKMFDEIPHPDLATWNSIIAATLAAGLDGAARRLFAAAPVRNVVTWSTMIDGLVKQGNYSAAIEFFEKMQREEKEGGERPNEYTYSSVLAACAGVGALEQGRWVHACIGKQRIPIDAVLAGSLIDMYSKCGDIEAARQVFHLLRRLHGDDVTAWSAMIAGLAAHGLVHEALNLFDQMLSSKIEPNSITFLGILCACVHGGLVREGVGFFNRMVREFGIKPSIEHYGCLVDLHARAGDLQGAWETVRLMTMEPDAHVWGALLSGARSYGDVRTCESAIQKLMEKDPTNSSAYVLLANAYARSGRWKEARQVRNLMEENDVKKTPGCSTVNISGELHEFFAGVDSSPAIQSMVEEMMTKLREAGYVETTEEALIDADEESKKLSLMAHSEKLAVAFALGAAAPGEIIRVFKNLRVCSDCHMAMKVASRVYGREIVVRDCRRFHRFRDGFCSCNDFW